MHVLRNTEERSINYSLLQKNSTVRIPSVSLHLIIRTVKQCHALRVKCSSSNVRPYKIFHII